MAVAEIHHAAVQQSLYNVNQFCSLQQTICFAHTVVR